MRKKSFKLISVVLVILILTAVLSGCGSGNDKNTSDNTGEKSEDKVTTTKEKKSEIIKISFVDAGASSTTEYINNVTAEIIAEYEKTHNVKITHDTVINEYRTWMTTQLAADNAPDLLCTKYTWSHEDFDKGYIYALDDYLEKENPYMPGKRWYDTISQSLWDKMKHPVSGTIAGVPTKTVAAKIFYNKDLFEKAGITKVPENWTEFIEAQKKLKDLGVVPFAFSNAANTSNLIWTCMSLTNQLEFGTDDFKQADINGNNFIDMNEVARAMDKGILDFSKQLYQDVFRVMKDWSQYWNKDFNATTEDMAINMFVRGDAAMGLFGSWHLKAIHEAEGRSFEYAIMPIPALTKEQSAYASGEKFVVGGNPEDVYCIPTTVKGEKFDAVLDFLQYRAADKAVTKVSTVLFQAPALVGVELPDMLKGFEVKEKNMISNYYGPATSQEFNKFIVMSSQVFLEGKSGLEEYTKKLTEVLKREMDKVKMENKWTEENGYGTK